MYKYSFLIIISILASCSYNPEANPISFGNLGETNELPLLEKTKKQQLSPYEYAEWVDNSNNGLIKRKEVGDYWFELSYKPVEYNTLKELTLDGLSQEKYNSTKKEFSGLQYFTLKIGGISGKEMMRTNLRNKEEYFGRVEYFAFPMQHDIELIEGTDTLNCKLFHFERTYNALPYNSFVIGFEESSTNKIYDKTFTYYDKALGVGPVKLIVDKQNIQEIPEIKIN